MYHQHGPGFCRRYQVISTPILRIQWAVISWNPNNTFFRKMNFRKLAQKWNHLHYLRGTVNMNGIIALTSFYSHFYEEWFSLFIFTWQSESFHLNWIATGDNPSTFNTTWFATFHVEFYFVLTDFPRFCNKTFQEEFMLKCLRI